MGDRLRRYLKQLMELSIRAAMPAMIIFAILLGSFVVKGTPNDIDFQPANYLRILLVCYMTAFIATCILHFRSLIHAAIRPDEHLIGKTFSGFRQQDKLFCTAMAEYSVDRAQEALELFLELQDQYELTEPESGVLCFYIGRCYQLLNCPSNAIPYYRKAREKGFSQPFSMLFEARSQSDGGCFEQSLELYQSLLDNDPPAEFFFLYTDIGYLFIRQKQPEEAFKWFRKSIEEKQNYAFALSGMAIASLQTGDFRAAQDYHYKALINRLKDPSSFRSYFAETKKLMLEEHPEWSPKTGAKPETETDNPSAKE